MSKANMVLSRFIAMARRITGFDERGYGHLIFIAQAEKTIDVNIRELTSEIKYMLGHWVVNCRDCDNGFGRTSEDMQVDKCPNCESGNIFITDNKIEVLTFVKWENYFAYRMGVKGKHYSDRYIVDDTKRYFKYYDTMQITDLWDDYINE